MVVASLNRGGRGLFWAAQDSVGYSTLRECSPCDGLSLQGYTWGFARRRSQRYLPRLVQTFRVQ